ncbi:MAG: hypothetical protein KDE14_01405 [Rhodobacteraceae bacterium]|nr:hypothetical protein [Paracoccaceae bacterium]
MTNGDVAHGPDTASGEADQQPQTTHFNFVAKVFRAPGARFYKPENFDEPVFVVDLGDMRGEVRLAHLRKQFAIEPGGHDDVLMDTAVKALNYVEDIRPGDRIPNEIIDGSASWSVSARHKVLAKIRLEGQLIAWISGKDFGSMTAEQFEQFLAAKENKAALRNAFNKAAVELGSATGDHTAVLLRIELLARELCFIEALREAFSVVPSIAVRLKQIADNFGGDIRMMDTITRVRGLMRKGIQEYSGIFAAVDHQSDEIIVAMREIDGQISMIRERRDGLRFLQIKWNPLVEAWKDVDLGQGNRVSDLLGRTYRFLATRFDTSKSLMKARREAEDAQRQAQEKAEPRTQRS